MMGTLGNNGNIENRNYNFTWSQQKMKRIGKKVKSSILLSCLKPKDTEIHYTFTFSQDEESFDYNATVQK